MAHFHVYSQTVADGTATSVVRPSDWNSGHLNSITISGNTSNFSTVSGTNIVYQGGNNVTISAATAANAATLVFSAANQTVQTQSNVQGISAGTQVGQTGNIVFSNSNGISFGMSNSSIITASYTVPSTAGLLSAINVSGGTTSNNLSAVTFSNLNGISFGLNGSVITGSHNALTTARASTDAVGLNTAQTNVTWTVNSSGLSLNAAGYAGTGTTFAGTNVSASATFNSNGLNLALSAPSPVGGAVNFSAGTTSNNLANVVFANSNLLSFGLNGSTITGSVPATSSLVGVNLTITSAGSTISISAPVINKYEPVPLGNNTSYSSYGQNTLYFQGISPVENVSMSALDMYVSMSSASSSISHSVGQTMSYGIYSRGTGASTSRYDIMQSSSFVMQASFSSNLSGGMTLGNAATSFTSSSAGTVFASVLSGQKIVSMPFGTSLSAGGNYLLCWAVSTTSTGGTGALRASYLVQTNMTNGSWGILANSSVINSNQSITINPSVIAIYSATSSSWPASIGNTQFSINSANKAYLFLEA